MILEINLRSFGTNPIGLGHFKLRSFWSDNNLKQKSLVKMSDMYLADKAAFDAAIAAATDKLLVIDFTATWCPPC